MMYFNIAKFMKNNILNSGLCLALGMAASFSLSSCEDWTEVESLDIQYIIFHKFCYIKIHH